MTNITIEAGKLLSVLKYVQMTGRNIKGEQKPLLEDCLIKVVKQGLKIISKDINDAVIVEIKLKLTTIKQIGNIPIELEKIINILKRFNSKDKIMVDYNDDTIYLERKSPKLSFKTNAIAEDKVKSSYNSNLFQFKNGIWIGKQSGFKVDTYIKLDSKQFSEIVLDGEQIQYRSFPFSCIDKKLEVTVEDSDVGDVITRELQYIEIKNKDDIKSIYSLGFGNVFGQLTGEIEIWITNESPMIIRKKIDDLEVIYVLTTLELEKNEEELDEQEEHTNDIEDKLENIVEDNEEELDDLELDEEELDEEELDEEELDEEIDNDSIEAINENKRKISSIKKKIPKRKK